MFKWLFGKNKDEISIRDGKKCRKVKSTELVVGDLLLWEGRVTSTAIYRALKRMDIMLDNNQETRISTESYVWVVIEEEE